MLQKSKEYGEMKETLKKIWNVVSTILVVLIVLCAVFLMGSRLMGYRVFTVISGSMEPEFAAGDLIVVKQTGAYAQNDIVVFQDGRSLVVHRIISLDGETVTTKGDANNTADAPIHISAIKGEVIFWIPYMGNVVEFIKTPVGTLCIIAAILLLLEIPRRNEKKKNDEEKQKIIDEIKRLKED
jgi:signal peptidase